MIVPARHALRSDSKLFQERRKAVKSCRKAVKSLDKTRASSVCVRNCVSNCASLSSSALDFANASLKLSRKACASLLSESSSLLSSSKSCRAALFGSGCAQPVPAAESHAKQHNTSHHLPRAHITTSRAAGPPTCMPRRIARPR